MSYIFYLLDDKAIKMAEKQKTSEQDLLEKPVKGTFIIMFIYGILFTLGWLYMWFGIFVPRGAVN